MQNRIILWTGKRHSGKTTNVARLTQKVRNEGFNVCGLLAPCVCRDGKLVGFDVLDLRSNNRAPLARRKTVKGKGSGPGGAGFDSRLRRAALWAWPSLSGETAFASPTSPKGWTGSKPPSAAWTGSNRPTAGFNFIIDGLKLGNAALGVEAVRSADLVIVDEFGKLELNGRGWRKNVDSLLVSSDAVILLVVRLELADAVRQLYTGIPHQELAATKRDSIDVVITMLKNRCRHIKEHNVQA